MTVGVAYAVKEMPSAAYESGARPGSALTVMLASPALNPAALALTIPLIVVGVLASRVVMQANATVRPADTLLGLMAVAAVALLLALPTFFELPIALVALAAGAPGLAAVILVAGPIVNLPTLLIVGREVGPKTSVALAGGVWRLAVAVGMLVLAVR